MEQELRAASHLGPQIAPERRYLPVTPDKLLTTLFPDQLQSRGTTPASHCTPPAFNVTPDTYILPNVYPC
ncbi:hypothetical protein GCM10022420_009220 [Streptomyces iranensis]|uniref:Uncharacterized protein n=1 Tax=Streptomyces iranensis TaxID=576784 RepID=A0ABS4MZS9_9ACTN|nr:hypothetical protein [Streptomyces iranensis]